MHDGVRESETISVNAIARKKRQRGCRAQKSVNAVAPFASALAEDSVLE